LWVLCVCQVEVSATGWSLVQRSPADCGVSLCVISKPQEWGGWNPQVGCKSQKKKKKKKKKMKNLNLVAQNYALLRQQEFTFPSSELRDCAM
jgi:hypothetical protein